MIQNFKKIESFINKIINPFFSLLVPPYFWIQRWLQDKVFLVNLRDQNLPPGIQAYPIWLIYSFFKYTKKLWRKAYIDYGLKCYSIWIGEHYSPSGRGYYNYENLSGREKLGLYGEPSGRIEYFLKNYPRTLKYEDGQSILDAGCGRGQNIKVLSEYFPTLKIKAFDLSEGALSVVELGVENQKQIQTEVGSIADINYLKQYPTNGFDHVLVSHVFSLIIDGGEEKTHKLRQNIIDNLIRISKKTVLILDSPNILQLKEPVFRIEQLQRAHYGESSIPYFNEHLEQGEVTAIFSSESLGLLFRHF